MLLSFLEELKLKFRLQDAMEYLNVGSMRMKKAAALHNGKLP